MTDAAKIADCYIALWNEADKLIRMEMLKENWSEDATYVDPLMAGAGHAQISELVGGVQQRFPDFRFSLLGEPNGYDGHVRFSWSLGPAGADAPIKGSDVVTLERGRLKAVIGFLDQVPAAA
ncbi:MAG TPA: nuclear transport factor 2 family protein [Pararhizobium sp.]|nr:nuclear transport factor 2 family protein [Pararhizobium sp.]